MFYGVGLVHSLDAGKTGVTRSLIQTVPLLPAHGVELEPLDANSWTSSSKTLAMGILGRFRRPDFLLVNGASALALGKIACPVARWAVEHETPVIITWHETAWNLEKLRREHPSIMPSVEFICVHPLTLHLTASKAGTIALRAFLDVAAVEELYECASPPPAGSDAMLPADPPRVVNVASVQARKGPDLFLETARFLLSWHPSVEFHWYGDGPELEEYRRLASSPPFANRVFFHGHVSEPMASLAIASALFLSSRDDPFPLAVLEAMSLSRSIVVFDVGGAPEGIGSGDNLIPPFDCEAAARALRGIILKSPSDRRRPDFRTRFEENYTPQHYARNLAAAVRGHVLKRK